MNNSINNNKTVTVYTHSVNGVVKYVGASTNSKRPYDMVQRSYSHKFQHEFFGMTVEIVEEGLTIKQGSKLEIKLINNYGIENLLNKSVSNAGLGFMSEITKAKIAQTRIAGGLNKKGEDRSEKCKAYSQKITKLTQKDVMSIISQSGLFLTYNGDAKDFDAKMAKEYGVNVATIGLIRNRKGRFSDIKQTLKKKKVAGSWNWSWLQEGEVAKANKPKRGPKRKMKKRAKYGSLTNKK